MRVRISEARALRSYHGVMPSAPVTYHWLEANTIEINPPIFTEIHADINLPAGHTLRRLLVSEPLFFWKRASVSFEDQQSYFVSYRITYGAAEGAPILYRSTRALKSESVCNPTAVTDVFCTRHYGADLELGINERVQRGGYGSFAQRLRLAWAIYSSGAGAEVLAGQASVPFRALYSLPIAP
jgi:hypothetical protein